MLFFFVDNILSNKYLYLLCKSIIIYRRGHIIIIEDLSIYLFLHGVFKYHYFILSIILLVCIHHILFLLSPYNFQRVSMATYSKNISLTYYTLCYLVYFSIFYNLRCLCYDITMVI